VDPDPHPDPYRNTDFKFSLLSCFKLRGIENPVPERNYKTTGDNQKNLCKTGVVELLRIIKNRGKERIAL
jgi:hypothetical protein